MSTKQDLRESRVPTGTGESGCRRGPVLGGLWPRVNPVQLTDRAKEHVS